MKAVIDILNVDKLPNGLTIYTIPKHGFHKTFAILTTNYGSLDLRFKQNGDWVDTPKGVAHFLEHLMFNTVDGNALTKLSTNGASANAYTSTNVTAYYFECVDKFSENLEILLDFVSTAYFTDENVETERGIIEQEVLMGEDDPDHALYYGLMESLFQTNPLRYPIAGTVDSINLITADTLHKCHNVFYNPANMVLCIAGDVDPSEIRKIAERILPSTCEKISARDIGLEEELTPVRFHHTKAMDVSLPIFLAGCKTTPPSRGLESLRYNLISAIALDFISGHSSQLYFNLYNEGLVSSDFSSSFDFTHNAAYSFFGGETRDPNRVFEAIKDEITRLSKGSLDLSYFNRIKKAALGSYVRSLNSFESCCHNIIDGHLHDYDSFEIPNVLSDINENDIISFYRNCLTPENMAISIISPRG